MATVDKNQARDSRIQKLKGIQGDPASIQIKLTSDEKVEISSLIRTLDNFADLGSAGLNKLDYWDDLPDFTDSDKSITQYNQNRTIVYSGKPNGMFRRGFYYKCRPMPESTWSAAKANDQLDVLHCPDTVNETYLDSTEKIIIRNLIRTITVTIGSTNIKYVYDHTYTHNSTLYYCWKNTASDMVYTTMANPKVGATTYRITEGSAIEPVEAGPVASIGYDKGDTDIAEIYYEYVSNTDASIKIAFTSVLGAKTVKAYAYDVTTNMWGRSTSVTDSDDNIVFADYFNTFKECYIYSATSRIAEFFRVPETVNGIQVPFTWKQIDGVTIIPMFPYDTITPSNNVCFFNPTSACFYFGQISETATNMTISMDLTNLEEERFYGNNVIYFSTVQDTIITFEALKDGSNRPILIDSKDFNTVDDCIVTVTAGRYKALVEVVPDGTIVVMLKSLSTGSSSSSGESAYAYGIRYNMDSPSPDVLRIERREYTDVTGAATEAIDIVNSYTNMPCHDFKRCLVKNQEITHYLFKTNSLYLEDGVTKADLTGADGDVCVAMPKTYLRITVPYKPTTIGDEGEQYSGYIDYLVSTSPIPDPPKDSSGKYTTCYRLVYNGVHPAFRVGGEPELDSAGNTQYEEKYDYETDSFKKTDIVLRKASDQILAAAFASVRCGHVFGSSAYRQRACTLKATTDSDTDLSSTITSSSEATPSHASYIRPSSDDTFATGKNYPIQDPGIAVGGISTTGTYDYANKTFAVANTQARSIAPYRDGELVSIKLSGVLVNIAVTGSTDSPALMPGGCSTTFGCTSEAANDDITPSTSYKYKSSMSFVQADGSVVTKDYTIEFKTDHWEINDGKDVMAKGTFTGTFTSFDSVTWTFEAGQIKSGTVTMSTSDNAYKLTIGPMNYGNRASNFNWDKQNMWDDAMTGNPNWALNYRPLVSVSRANFQYIHGNAGYVLSGEYKDMKYSATDLRIDVINTERSVHDYSLPTGETYCDFTFLSSLDETQCFNNNSANIWHYLVNDVTKEIDKSWCIDYAKHMDYDSMSDTADEQYRWCFAHYLPSSDVTFTKGKAYYHLINDTYTRKGVIYAVGDNIPANTYWTDYACTTLASGVFDADTLYYYKSGSAIYQAPIHGTKLDTDEIHPVTYERYTLAQTDQDYQAHNDSTVCFESHYIDPSHRSIKCYDIGYMPVNSLGPITDRYPLITPTGLEESYWQAQDENTNYLNKVWYYTDDNEVMYRVAFDHASMYWVISRRDENDNWIPMYNSHRIDPTQFVMSCTAANNYSYFIQRHFTRHSNSTAADACTIQKNSIMLGLLPEYSAAYYPFILDIDGFIEGGGTSTDHSTAAPDIASSFSNASAFDCYTRDSTTGQYTKVTSGTWNSNIKMILPYQTTTDAVYDEAFDYFMKNTSVTPKYFEPMEVEYGTAIPSEVITAGLYKFPRYKYRKWVNYENHFVIEYINSTDTRLIGGVANHKVGEWYGGEWIVAKYSDDYSSIQSIITSSLDCIQHYQTNANMYGVNEYLATYIALNPWDKDHQRTYDISTGNTTNTSLVYKLATSNDHDVSNNHALMFFIDENGNLPAYLEEIVSTTTLNSIKEYANSHTDLSICETSTANIAVKFWHHYDATMQNLTFTYVAATDVHDRKWTYSSTYGIEYIKDTDTRILFDGTPITKYKNTWAILRYGSATRSDGLKEVNYVVHGSLHGSWIVLKFTDSTYASILTTTNTTVNNGQTNITPAHFSTHGWRQQWPCKITENGPFEAYNLFTTIDVAGYSLTRDTVFKSGVTYYTRSGEGTASKPYTYTVASVVVGAEVTANTYYVYTNRVYDANGVDITDNERTIAFQNVNTINIKKKSKRAYNCNTRLKQYMALMMVIDGGTFDTQTGISTGKSWLSVFNYAKSTFSGRTATLGNITGEILWDKDVDINIQYADWSSQAQADSSKQVVAFNWRGFENPFGNIGEYEDGIIPCTRFIDGHEVTGYYECIDPDSYSDTMKLTNCYKQIPAYASSVTAVTPTFSEYMPSPVYSWVLHSFPASGWIKRWDPLTFLPTAVGGSSTTYCCGLNQRYGTILWQWIGGYKLVIVRGLHIRTVTGKGDVKECKSMFYTHDCEYGMLIIGTRLQF